MKPDSQKIAKKLAQGHKKADPSTQMIKYFPSNHHKEVRLLEVSSTAPTTGEILPFRFGPDTSHGIDLPSVVILISPQEWEDVKSGRLKLPHSWDLNKAIDL